MSSQARLPGLLGPGDEPHTYLTNSGIRSRSRVLQNSVAPRPRWAGAAADRPPSARTRLCLSGILTRRPLHDRQELLLDPLSVTFRFPFQSKCQQSGIRPLPSSGIFRTNKQLTYLAKINHLKKPGIGSFFAPGSAMNLNLDQ